MKKKTNCLLIAMVLVLTVSMFAGCGSNSSSNGGTPSNSGSNAEDEPYNVAVVLNGTRGDKSFNDLAYNGIILAKELYNISESVAELNQDPTKQAPTLMDFSEDENIDLIVSGTANLKEATQTAAVDYPEKLFIMYDTQADFEDLGLSNVYSQSYLQNEGSFLAGALAAKFTTSGVDNTNPEKIIGFIAGGENTTINDFLVGYINGAKYVDPDIKILISYIGDFKNSGKGKEMALAQYSQGADIIFQVAALAGVGVLEAGAETGCYTIGVDIDQYELYKTERPEIANQIVSSVVKKVDVALCDVISRAIEGTLPWGAHEYYGIKEQAIGIAKSDNYGLLVPDDIKAEIEKIEEDILNGTITSDMIGTAIGASVEEINEIRNSVSLY